MIIINKANIFNEDMIKDVELVEYFNYKEDLILVERDTFSAFKMLQANLKIKGINIDIESGYRSLEKQESIFLDYYKKDKDYLNKVAMPGFSEHHLGTSIDLAVFDKGKWISNKEELLNLIEPFKIIHKEMINYGFILRYPKGKEEETGYFYMPWHLRYVGIDISLKIRDSILENIWYN